MNNNILKSRERIKKLVFIAVFSALAYASRLVIQVPIMFLTLDVKDTVITLCAMFFGPVAGVTTSFLAAFIEFITVSDTHLYGFIMNFFGSAAFSLTAGLIYKYKRNFKGGVLGIVCAVFVMTATMMVANLIVTPYFMKSSVEEVIKLIPKVLLPFNFTKGVINAALVMALYKPMSNVLKAIGVVKKKENENLSFGKKSVIVTVLSLVIAATAFVLILTTMK